MPGIVTHHVFGIDAYRNLSEIIGDSSSALEAFLLGNLGPDPFFYLMATPATRKFRRIGQTMHKQKTAELLSSLHRHLIEGGEHHKDSLFASNRTNDGDSHIANDRTDDETSPLVANTRPSEARKAYALGFLCHYLLDSTVHPLVYAQQHAICDSKIEGLTAEWSHRVVHATIETALDEYILTTRLGATAATLPPHRTMLRCPVPALMEVSSAYAKVLGETYGLRVPETIFFTAVNLNKLAQQALDSKSKGLRQRFDYLAKLGMASAYVQALSHRNGPRPHTLFTNDDHIAWEVPFSDGETISKSFDELFSSALERAIEVLPAYADPAFDQKACEVLVNNVNFLGRTVE